MICAKIGTHKTTYKRLTIITGVVVPYCLSGEVFLSLIFVAMEPPYLENDHKIVIRQFVNNAPAL